MEKNTDTNNVQKMYGGMNCVMKITGIDLTNHASGVCCRLLRHLYPIMMHLQIIYFVCVHQLVTSFSMPLYIETMAGFMFSLVVWYLLRCKISSLNKVMFKMQSIQQHAEFRPFTHKFFQFICVFIVLLFICTVSVDVYYVEYGFIELKKIFTFKTTFESYIIKVAARLFLFSTYFMTLYQFPMISTLFCCFIYYNLSVIISDFSKKLKYQRHTYFSNEDIIQTFHKLSRLIELAYKVEKNLSAITFHLISLHMALLFGSVASLVAVKIPNMDIPYTLEFFTGVLMTIVGIISITICGTLTEKQFLNIKRNIVRMHEIYIHHPSRDTFTLELMKHMLSMDMPIMTAWSVFPLKPSLIFSAIGCCLTFGLLSKQLFD